ncbi:GrpE-domain-containing protein [Laetiporus sulphureus 93-53]|uniref:GrpE protein homolog, mitochondrial n=1 Tax=Laetiporus sulphureus 93-53 TaxID=1314785 RepID=A0A165FXI2_9APHY|nr:GrpE-domain-containing protein [Laetiporus sulphureus 93-53]KZT09546.1 GrpE-domain-containing protein [Laetiporus sulphureus 93-53]
MSYTQAFQIFRSYSSSLAVRSVARTSLPGARRRAAIGTRYYSDDKSRGAGGSESKLEGKEGESTQKAEGSDREAESKKGESAQTGEATAGSSELAQCDEKLKQKEAEVTDLTGRLRYLQADFLNLQRNAAREKEQTRDFAITRFASDLLETVDVLAMALKSVPQSALSQPSSSSSDSPTSPSSDSAAPISDKPAEKPAQAYLNDLYSGVEITHRLLLQTLFKYGVKPFDPTGDKFDPNRHEALYQAPVPGKEPGTVFDCQKTGYTIKERVLRAAQVGVVQDQA